jgi:hypothetical protein
MRILLTLVMCIPVAIIATQLGLTGLGLGSVMFLSGFLFAALFDAIL